MKRGTVYAATDGAKKKLADYEAKKAKKCKAGCGCAAKPAQRETGKEN
jgi:Holliday junction resolvasome RuvABC endonuclease subunit